MIYLFLDINVVCFNIVVEVLVFGFLVVGFDMGVLVELVREGVGEIVFYGGDFWNLDLLDIVVFEVVILKVYNNYEVYVCNVW